MGDSSKLSTNTPDGAAEQVIFENFPMSSIKPAINMKKAAKLVKSGANDGELMERLGLSPAGIEELLAALLATGRVTQVELDFRSKLNESFDDVDLFVAEPKRGRKTRIHAEAALADLRRGLSDTELMRKYKLSVKGLNSLYGKLVDAGQITQHELESLRAPRVRPAALVNQAPPQEELLSNEPYQPYSAHAGKPFLKRHRVGMAAGLGALVGAMCVMVVMGVTLGPEKLREFEARHERAAHGTTAEAERLVKTLESIRATSGAPTPIIDRYSETEYRECLKNCGEDSPNPDDADRSLAANCRRECLNKHSKRFQAIRRLYHGEK